MHCAAMRVSRKVCALDPTGKAAAASAVLSYCPGNENGWVVGRLITALWSLEAVFQGSCLRKGAAAFPPRATMGSVSFGLSLVCVRKASAVQKTSST